MEKTQIVSVLRDIAVLEENEHKARRFAHAAEVVEVETEMDDYRVFYGIGDSIQNVIDELRETGKSTRLENLKAEAAVRNPDLYKIRKGFVTKRIPYAEAETAFCKIAAEVEKVLEGTDSWSNHVMCAGSMRRRKRMIGDLDMVVCCSESSFQLVLNMLSEKYRVLTRGEYKASFVIDEKVALELDIIRTDADQLPFQLLYLTGSKEFNIKMRAHAKRLGFLLNQKGLFWEGEHPVHCANEADIFRALQLPYVLPENR